MSEQIFQCKECPLGYIFVAGRCINQITGCQQYNPNGQCSQCAAPFQLTVNGQCQILGCKRYSAQGCDECVSPFRLQNSVCVIPNCAQYSSTGCVRCQDNFILSNNQCISKDPNCLAYDLVNGQTACVKCAARYFLLNGQCKVAEKGCAYDTQGKCTCKHGFYLR